LGVWNGHERLGGVGLWVVVFVWKFWGRGAKVVVVSRNRERGGVLLYWTVFKSSGEATWDMWCQWAVTLGLFCLDHDHVALSTATTPVP